MLDGTVLIHDLLGSLWTTANLSAVIQQEEVELPFDRQLSVFLKTHLAHWKELISGIGKFCHAPPEMMERERDYSPWQKLSPTSTLYDARGVTIEFILAMGEDKWIEIEFANRGEVQQLARKALTPCLRRTMSRLFTLHRFFTGSEAYDRRDLNACLLPLKEILGSSWHTGSPSFMHSLLDLNS